MQHSSSNSPNWLDVVDELDQLPPEERANRLAQFSLSAADRERVVKLLGFGDRATDFLNVAPASSRVTDPSISYDVPAEQAESPRIDGYTITGRLGEGGMGTVWRAVQLSTNRDVALKILTLATFGSHRARQRFEREVELTAKLEHPNIAHVFDSGVRHGAYFYAMELIDGVPLDQFVKSSNLSARKVIELMRLVCRAIQHAHQRGIIHRDLKPSNILVTPAGEPKVLDFGLAKAVDGDRKQVSLDGDLAGTPAYMSPEQASGQLDRLDTRSDVYTLGVILFHLLTGQFPHDTTGSHIEIMCRVAEREPRRLRDIDPHADRELEVMIAKATAREPAQRYSSAGELADDLGRYLSGEPLIARPPTVSYLLKKKIRKHRLPLAIAAIVLAALGGMAIWSYVSVAESRDVAIAATIEKEKKYQEAETNRLKAEASDRKAEIRVAETLIAQGDALTKAKRWNLALDRFEDARSQFSSLALPTAAADYAAWETLRASSPLLLSVPGIGNFAMAPDGPGGAPRVLAKSPGGYQIWDVGRCTKVVEGDAGIVGSWTALATSGDGRVAITGGDDGNVTIWDITGEPPALVRRCLLSNSAASTRSAWTVPTVKQVAIAADASVAAATSSDEMLRLWDLRSGKLLRTIIGIGQTGLPALAVSPGGRFAVSQAVQSDPASKSSLQVWEVPNGTPLSIHNLKGGPMACAFSPDGRTFASGDFAGELRFFDIKTGQKIWAAEAHERSVAAVAFSPDGKLAASASWDQTIRVWDLHEHRLVQTIDWPAALRHVAFSHDSRLLIAGDARMMGVWPAQPPAAQREGFHPPRRTYVASVNLSSDGRMAAVTEAGTAVYVIDVATGRQLQRLDAHAVVRSAEFGPGDHTLIAGCADRKHPGRIWNVGNWSQVQDAPQDGMPPKKGGDGTAEWRQIHLSADGRSLLALRDDGKLSVCDPQTGQALRRLAEGDGTPYVTGAISTDGALALGITADDTLRLWDARSGLPLRTLEIPPKLKKSGLRAAISPDGKRIVAGDKSGVLHAWDVATGRHLYASAGQGSIINQVTFADAAGRVVLTAHSNARINVWEAETGRPLRSITVTDTAIVADIDCIPARGLVAAGLRHGRIYFLDFELLSRWRDQRPRAEQAARTLRDTPDDPQALLTMGRWYALHGLLDMAGGLMIRACERGAEVSPLELGRIFWQTDQFDAAAAEFRRAIELAKDDGERGYLRACLAAVSQKSKAPATQETE